MALGDEGQIRENSMPVHDWSRVKAGIFHDFHNAWITHLKEALNGGLLPEGYYALSEQHVGRVITDILAADMSRSATTSRARQSSCAPERKACRAWRRRWR